MIIDNVREILAELPEGVKLIAATKDRSVEEIIEVISAGIDTIGENYIQEALQKSEKIRDRCKWHFIGHLQTNKVKYAVNIFDLIETVDSIKLAREIDRRCVMIKKVMPVLIEINSGREPQKYGVLPEDTEDLLRDIATLKNIEVQGLMTMGPFTGDPEYARPYFKTTRELFKGLKDKKIPGIEMKFLSMGMSNSYSVAVEEGANMVRIGTKIFGER